MKTSGVAAVERALAILDAFREGDDGLTLAEIAERTRMYKSTILRLCASLEKYGYLWRVPDGRYRLGPTPMRLGSLYQRGFPLADRVVPVLRRLAKYSGESASFYIRHGAVRVCLHRVDSPAPIRDHVREGDHLPLDRGAAGRVLLAFGGARGSLFAAVRRDLVAASFGERNPETAAVACPVFGVEQELVGVLSLSGPLYRFRPEAVRRMSSALMREAADLTAALGGDRRPFDKRMATRVTSA
ncbi:MAG: IclR family transcriptional regulator [Armatimonadetes bacterium]|nr:IclR family transcriptional regulator [Armatimonadota bacterium]